MARGCGLEAGSAATRAPDDGSTAVDAAVMPGALSDGRSPSGWMAGGYVCVQAQPRDTHRWRRRAVFGGMLLLLGAVACAAAASRWQGTGALGSSAGSKGVELLSQDEIDAGVQQEDEAACADLDGVLRTTCIENRQKARAAPKFWSEDEVRQGLWKTEKALADLQVRQYKHSKEIKEAHDAHKDKFATFKERMEGALDLIHKIQDEMGLRHSQMVTRLRADIALTQTRLRTYLDQGEAQVSSKVQTLEERETALTARLIAMMDSEAAQLSAALDARHAEEAAKTKSVAALATSVEAERVREDARLTAALEEAKRRIDALRTREDSHVATVREGTTAQDAKRATDTAALNTKVTDDSTAAGAALSSAMAGAKTDVRQRLEAAEAAAYAALAGVSAAAGEAAGVEEGRASSEGAAEAKNNTAQAAVMAGLQSSLTALNTSTVGRLNALEAEAGRLEAAVASGVEALDQERATQRGAVLAHVDAAMAVASQAHGAAEARTRGEVSSLGPAAAQVASALAAAEQELQQQQEADLAALNGKVDQGTKSIRSSSREAQDSIISHANTNLDSEAALAASRRAALQGKAAARGGVLGGGMDAWAAGQEANNTAQGKEIAAAKTALALGEAARSAADTALISRLEALVSATAGARAQLLGQQTADMGSARTKLRLAVGALKTGVEEALSVAEAKWKGEVVAGIKGQARGYKLVANRVATNEKTLQDDATAEAAKHAAAKVATEAALQAMEDEQGRRRALWRAAVSARRSEAAALAANLTQTSTALETQRTAIKDEQLQSLSASLAAAKAAVLAALGGVTERVQAAVSGEEAAGSAALSKASAAEAATLGGSTLLVGGVKSKQEAWDGGQEAGAASVDATRGGDGAREHGELVGLKGTLVAAAGNNAAAQGAARAGISADASDSLATLRAATSLLHARLTAAVSADNVTLTDEVRNGLRDVQREVERLGWTLDARSAALKAEHASVEATARRAFLKEDDDARALKAARQRLSVKHAEALDALDARVSALQRQLTRDEAASSAALRTTDATTRASMPSLIAAAEARLDAKLHAGEVAGATELGDEASKAAAASSTARGEVHAAESSLVAVLTAAEQLLEEHGAAQRAAVAGANRTVVGDAGGAAAAAQLLAPTLAALMEKLSTEATRLRAVHAAAAANNNKLVDSALVKLSSGADASFGDSREALALVVSQTYQPVERELNAMEAGVVLWDVRAKGALAAARAGGAARGSEELEALRGMEAASDAAQANLTAEVAAIRTHVQGWKEASEREQRAVAGGEAGKEAAFKRALAGSRGGVQEALDGLRDTFNARIASLNAAIAETRSALATAQQGIQAQHRADYADIRATTRQGVAGITRTTRTAIATQVAGAQAAAQAPIDARAKDVTAVRGVVTAAGNELTRRSNAAGAEERRGDRVQEAKLNALKGQIESSKRQGSATLSALEVAVQNARARLTRQSEEASAAQARAIETESVILQRKITAINPGAVGGTVALRNYKSTTDAKLGALRRYLAASVAAKNNQLTAVDRRAVQELGVIAAGIGGQETRVEALERGDQRRADQLAARKTVKLAWLKARLAAIQAWRTRRVDQYSTTITRQYEATKGRLSTYVDAMEQALTRSMTNRAAATKSRMGALTRTLSSELTGIDNSIDGLARVNANNHAWLAAAVERVTDKVGTTAALEGDVTAGLASTKEAVRVLARNISLAVDASHSELDALQREVTPHAGMLTQVTELRRSVSSIQSLVNGLRSNVRRNTNSLDAGASRVSQSARATKTYILREIARLRRVLRETTNYRRMRRTQRQTRIQGWHDRIDRWNATLTTRDNLHRVRLGQEQVAEEEEEEAPPETTPPPPPPPVPPPEGTLFTAAGKPILNPACLRLSEDPGRQSSFLAQCMTQDCEQALAPAGGCRFHDANGFCYAARAAQEWCASQAPPNSNSTNAEDAVEEEAGGVCADGGGDFAMAPIGSAATRDAIAWRPFSGETWACACMKDCTCSATSCECASESAFPSGDAGHLFLRALSRPVVENAESLGKCSCRCTQN